MLTPIMRDMNIEASTVQWLSTGFTLMNAIMIPITAFLTDRFSVRRLFVTAMSIFTVGSLVAGWGVNFPVLLGGRLLQAAGAGMLMPMVMTVLLLTYPPEKRGSAMGLFGLVTAFAPAIGPTFAGLVIDNASWHILFFVIAAISIVVIIGALFTFEKGNAAHKNVTLDKLSVIMSTVGFSFTLYGFSSIGSSGISIMTVAPLIVGIVVLVLFFRRQLHLETPMLQVRVLTNRTFLVATIIGMLAQASLLAAGILLPIYLQSLMGYSATISGLIVLPGAIIMGVMGPVAGRLFDKHGPRAMSIVGMALMTVAFSAFAFLLTDTTNILIIGVLYAMLLLALSLVNMPITTWAMNSLDDAVINHGNAVNNTFRQVASSLGTALIVSVMTAATAAGNTSMDSLHASIFGVNVAFVVISTLCLGGLVLAIIFVKKSVGKQVVSDPDSWRLSVLEKLMRRDVYSLKPNATVREAVELLINKGISAAPIIDNSGKAIGFVSDGDIMRHLSKYSRMFIDPYATILRTDDADSDLNAKVDALMKGSIMSIAKKSVIGVSVHDSLVDVCRVLGDNHLKKVPVLNDEGQVDGVINTSDVTEYVMESFLKNQAIAV